MNCLDQTNGLKLKKYFKQQLNCLRKLKHCLNITEIARYQSNCLKQP